MSVHFHQEGVLNIKCFFFKIQKRCVLFFYKVFLNGSI